MKKIIRWTAINIILLFMGQGYLEAGQPKNPLPAKIQIIVEILKNSTLEYQFEKEGQDYWKAPYETERDGGGDCEDLTLWLFDKLTKMGYSCWPIIGVDEAGSYHMWLRIVTTDGSYWDVDMAFKLVHPGFLVYPFNDYDLKKLRAVMERQEQYETSLKETN